MRGKAFTTMEEAIIKDMFHRGASIADIAKRTSRTNSSIRTRLKLMGLKISERDAKNGVKPAVLVEPAVKEVAQSAEPNVVIKQKTLADFSPREIIKHLYNLGYRIKGDLYQIVEKKVLLNDIIA